MTDYILYRVYRTQEQYKKGCTQEFKDKTLQDIFKDYDPDYVSNSKINVKCTYYQNNLSNEFNSISFPYWLLVTTPQHPHNNTGENKVIKRYSRTQTQKLKRVLNYLQKNSSIALTNEAQQNINELSKGLGLINLFTSPIQSLIEKPQLLAALGILIVTAAIVAREENKNNGYG